jgi:phage shock protein E
MSWTYIFIAVGVLVVFYVVRRAGHVSSTTALTHLKAGALVIDVRTAGEYSSGHLPKAINIPLDEIESSLPRRVKDKDQLLLLHCQGGSRSSAAVKKLNAMGYAKAFNLGSYGRAAGIVGRQ